MPSHLGAGAALVPSLGVWQTPPAQGPLRPPLPRGLACVQGSACHCWGGSGGGFLTTLSTSFHYFCSLLLKMNLSHGSSWGQHLLVLRVCPAHLSGCLVAGDCVLEEEGQVHQPAVEAHRHLGPHGPAAAPGQLRRARRAPAGGPACECVGPSSLEPLPVCAGSAHSPSVE